MGVLSTIDLEQKTGCDAEAQAAAVENSTLAERAAQHDEARQQAESDAAQNLLKQATGVQAEEPKSAKETEDEKRKAHEASEAKRKAEWEAKKKAREEAEMIEWEKAVAVDDDALIASSVKRLGDATERLTRRNMKLCVTEFVQTKCYEDMAFARQVMHPRKNMLNCFRFINRKAKEYIEQEMKDNDEKPMNGVYGSDVPDELCYQWAEEYFNNLDVPEDKDENDKDFVPKPYTGSSSSRTKKKPEKKPAEKKKPESQKEPDKPKGAEEQMTLFGTEVA